MWLQIVADKTIEGERYRPGDWYDADKVTARRWLAQGEVWVPPDRVQELLPSGSGIVATRENQNAQALARRFQLGLNVGPPSMPFARTLIWNVDASLRVDMVPVGFGLLETWQMAVPLRDHDTLAADVGTEAEREKTRAVIHDLRVPVYNTSVIFAQDCEETRLLFQLWEAEGGGELAFLRSLYQARPMILALPSIWVQGE